MAKALLLKLHGSSVKGGGWQQVWEQVSKEAWQQEEIRRRGQMTREQLKEYQSKRVEIRELRYKLDRLCEELADNDVVMDYRSGYPVPKAVVGVESGRYWRLHDSYKRRIEQLERECAEIEEYIEGIPDSMTRRIFRMIFLEGKTQRETARIMHLERSSISKWIQKYFRDDKRT